MSHYFRIPALCAAGVVEYRPGNAEGITICDAKNANSTRHVPVLGIHGTADAVVPWDGDPLFGFVCTHTGYDGAQICNTEAWLRRYGCSNSSTVPWPARGPFSSQRWADCPVAQLLSSSHGQAVHMPSRSRPI